MKKGTDVRLMMSVQIEHGLGTRDQPILSRLIMTMLVKLGSNTKLQTTLGIPRVTVIPSRTKGCQIQALHDLSMLQHGGTHG